MRRVPLVVAAAAALVLPAVAAGTPGAGMPGHGDGGTAAQVHIGFATFNPRTTEVLVGESVTWTNDSARVHTVTADDEAFTSGRIGTQGSFTRRFDDETTVAYHCELHAGMIGIVSAQRLLLDAPKQAAAPGRRFPLTGRAAFPAGGDVGIEADTGSGFTRAGHATVEPDGSFRALVTPRATGRYRAVAGQTSSAPVQLRVTDRRIAFTARRRAGDLVRLRATVTPASVGAPVVLQLYLPERFGWWPVRRATLDGTSQAAFAFRLRRRVAARVLLTLPDFATPLAISTTRRIGTRRRGP